VTDRARTEQMRAQLLADVPAWFTVDELQDGGWSIGTPFIYGDGDGLPVVLEHGAGGWRFTDRGSAASHLFYDDVEVTPAVLAFLQRLADAGGYGFDGGVLTSEWTADMPTVFDLADFIQAVAQIQAARALEP
jgi:hypothetical protein